MSIEPIGLVTFIVSLICLYLGYQATAATLVVATLLGSAAAIQIGAANIPPAHVLLAFLAASIFTRRAETARALEAMRFPEPGFWLISLVVYGVITGYLMPRLFAGGSQIVPLGVSLEYASTGTTVPLGPVSSNLTQAIYLIGDAVCFVMIVAIASTQAGFAVISAAAMAYVAGNVAFALLDIATYSTGTQWLMEPIRNATYTLHIDEEVRGMKRIAGSFTEASAFAGQTLVALGFVGTLWVCGRRPFLTGTLALASLVLVVLSTSSIGLAGTPPTLMIIYITALMRRGIDFRRPLTSSAVLCAPLLVLALFLALQLDDDARKPISDYIDTLIFNKVGSDSANERGSWNSYALQNFFDSYGLGLGLGTVRASSFPLALLSNVGLPGTIFYVLFALSAFVRRRGIPGTYFSDVRLAARNSCVSLILAAAFVGTAVDQGLFFYLIAGLACAEPERRLATFAPVAIQPSGARI
jgi:hypothetical protein